MENLKDWIQLAMFGAVVIGWLYSLLKKVEDPDQKAKDRLNKIEGLMKERERFCGFKHKIVDDNYDKIEKGFSGINKELQLFKQNGLDHIEDRITSLDNRMATLSGSTNTMIELMKEVLSNKK